MADGARLTRYGRMMRTLRREDGSVCCKRAPPLPARTHSVMNVWACGRNWEIKPWRPRG